MSLGKVVKKPATPFERIGGREAIGRMVDRFYDLMENDPAYGALRAIHAPDLGPVRESLTDFLVAWMGGPRDWFDKRPGACIMSAHGAMPGVDRTTAGQWVDAMTRAAHDTIPDDPEFVAAMLDALTSMSRTMAARAEEKAAGGTVDAH